MQRLIATVMFAIGLILPAPAAWAGPTAAFDFVSYRALAPAPKVPAGDYRNPILPGFQPDPSIVKVGRDFYLVNSTFGWFPGLPIYHSTDLVHWQLVGNAIDRGNQLDFAGLKTNQGLFAPSISYHDGRFWIVNTCIGCGGNFVITAQQPQGPWSKPVWLDFGGIDPSLVWDDDGSAWIVYNDAPPEQPRYPGHRALWLQRFDPVAMKMLPERKLLVDGGVHPDQNPVWAEGPHIYKVGQFYYLMAAEGGTADRHSETIYRSSKVDGPYRPGPVNPILTQRDLPRDRPDPVEATGHADLVKLDDGSWWGVFLATRPFAGESTLLGRETFLLPVSWHDGWPLFLAPGKAVPLLEHRPALPPSAGIDWRSWHDDFTAPLSGEWIGLRTPGPVQRVAVDKARGQLDLFAGPDGAAGSGYPAFIGRRLRQSDAQYTTQVTFHPTGPGDFAGLLAFMDETHFATLGIEPGAIVARIRKASVDPQAGHVIARSAYTGSGTVELRIAIRGGQGTFAWRPAGSRQWRTLADKVDLEPLATIHAGLFTGLVVGPYAVSPQR